MAAHCVANREELLATLAQPRTVVFISVEWSGQERHGRETFAAFVDMIDISHHGLGIAFFVVGEECEGIAEWFQALALPASAGTGYGAVLWLENGSVKELVEYAAAVGVDGLKKRTLDLWGTT